LPLPEAISPDERGVGLQSLEPLALIPVGFCYPGSWWN